MKLSRKSLLIIGCVVLAVGAAATAVVAVTGRPSAQDVSEATAEVAADYTVPGGLVVWMEPDLATLTSDGEQSADGTVFARTVDAEGREVVTKLGPGVDARLWSGGSAPTVMVERWDCSCHVYSFDDATATWTEIDTLSEAPRAICATGKDFAYTQIGDDSTLVFAAKSTGKVHNTTTVPSMEGYQDLSIDTGPLRYDPSHAAITALAPAGDHVLAFSTNLQATQMTDYPSAQTGTLEGAGLIRASCPASDGRVYAAASGFEKGETLKVIAIDPQTLKPVSIADTGWVPSPVHEFPLLSHLQLLPTQNGVALWATENKIEEGTVAPTHLWLIQGDQVTETKSLPERIGIKAACGEDGSLLIYGGYARNVVSRFDPQTGGLTTAKNLSAPDGTWILVAAD